MRILALPVRAAPAVLRAAANAVAQRGAVAAFHRITFPVRASRYNHDALNTVAPRGAVAFHRIPFPVRAFSRYNHDNDDDANQSNPNNDENWNSRDMDNPADEEYDNDNANKDDHANYYNGAYWESHGIQDGEAVNQLLLALDFE